MKKLIGLFAVLALLLGLLYVISLLKIPQPFADKEATEVTVATVTEREATPVYEIDVQYPQFGIEAIDTAIQREVHAAENEIKSIPAAPADSSFGPNTLDGSYGSLYVGADIISFALTLSQYTGGAHPLTVKSGLAFDRITGEKLTLDDALTLTGLSLQELSQKASDSLKNQLGEALQFPEGAAADPKNFESFTVSKDSVTFIFQQYQVAAYAAGLQEVSVARTK